MQLNEWLFPLRAFHEMQGMEGGEVNASNPIVEGWFENIGATVMGRNMFGGGPGPWGEDPWKGFWGDNPPYHHPVFVLTHHAREPLVLARPGLPRKWGLVSSKISVRTCGDPSRWRSSRRPVSRTFATALLRERS
jgi:hypothetical protein